MRTPTPEIRRCLDARLVALLPELGLTEDDVAWPNAAFSPQVDRLYLRVFCLFAETAIASLGKKGFERLHGVYQISVLEAQGRGLMRAEETARALVDHFRGGTELACCGCNISVRTAWSGPPLTENHRLHIPVSAQWYCYAQK